MPSTLDVPTRGATPRKSPNSDDQCARKRRLVDSAMELLNRGYSVIAVNGKKATASWRKFQEERPSEDELRKALNKSDVTGIAVILGPVSGNLACRDFDTQESYQNWVAAYPDLAGRLPTVKTTRGFHVYFRAEGVNFVKMPDGELRGRGLYCVLPPSVHPDGIEYAWAIGLDEGELLDLDPVESGFAHTSPPNMASNGSHGSKGSKGSQGSKGSRLCLTDQIVRRMYGCAR